MLNIVYDFDGTLTNKPIPEIKLLSKIGYTSQEFEDMFTEYKKNTDIYSSYYKLVLDLLTNSDLPNNDSSLTIGSNDIIFNTGLEDYLNQFKHNIKHYILSSGIQVYLENMVLAHYFIDIFGTTFKYDHAGNIIGVDNIITDEQKVDYIKKINVANNREELDCTNLVYVGDGITDYYAFKFVKENGGTSILVYLDDPPTDKRILDVVNISFKADFSNNSELNN